MLRAPDSDGPDLDDASTLDDFEDMQSGQMKSSPPEVPIQVVTDTRPPSVASIRSAVSTRSSKSSSCGLQPENGEKLLIFRDEPPSQAKRVKQRPVPSSLAKSMPSTTSSRLQVATSTGNHTRSKSDTVVPQALSCGDSIFVASDTLVSLYDHTSRSAVQHCDPGTRNAPLAYYQNIIEELQQISEKRETLLHKLQKLGQRETALLHALANTHSTTTDTETTFSNNNADELIQLSQFSFPIPTSTSTVHTPKPTSAFKLPRRSTASAKPPLSRPISAPPQSTPPGSKRRTTDRAPLADKTQLSLSTFDSTPLYIAADMSASPTKSDTSVSSASGTADLPGTVKSKSSKTGTPKIKGGLSTARLRVRRNEPVFVPTKLGDDDGDVRAGGLGRREMRTPRTPKVSQGVAKAGAVNMPVQDDVTRGSKDGMGNGERGYVVPHTVLRKKWQF